MNLKECIWSYALLTNRRPPEAPKMSRQDSMNFKNIKTDKKHALKIY